MSSEPGEDIFAALARKFHINRSIDERRTKEAKPLSRAVKRRIYSGEPRNVQLNFKVPQSVRSRFEAQALKKRCKLVDILELALEALEGSEK